MKTILRISEGMHRELQEHLFPGDDKEALAFALCGSLELPEKQVTTVHKIFPVPYDICKRDADFISWPTEYLTGILEEAAKEKMGLLKIHSHPTGYNQFSQVDDKSDKRLGRVRSFWWDHKAPLISAVMLPSGEVFARNIKGDLSFEEVNKITVTAKILRVWGSSRKTDFSRAQKRNLQAFGNKTTQEFEDLEVAVVGCSGTGSPVIQLLGRLGVGKIILVDPDSVEETNLNRILGATQEDAAHRRKKVEVMKRVVEEMGFDTAIEAIPLNLFDSTETLKKVAGCDIIFGCVDSSDARDLLNRLAIFYLLPFFDLGTRISSDGKGGISYIGGTVHYVTPDSSPLMQRGQYSQKDLEAAHFLRTQPEDFDEYVKNAYIKDIRVDRPAVAPVNFNIANLAIMDLLNRLHPFTIDSPENYNTIRWLGMFPEYFLEAYFEKPEGLEYILGKGTISPFLDMPEFSTDVVIT